MRQAQGGVQHSQLTTSPKQGQYDQPNIPVDQHKQTAQLTHAEGHSQLNTKTVAPLHPQPVRASSVKNVARFDKVLSGRVYYACWQASQARTCCRSASLAGAKPGSTLAALQGCSTPPARTLRLLALHLRGGDGSAA